MRDFDFIINALRDDLIERPSFDLNLSFTSINHDSRHTLPNEIFVAIPCDFIEQNIKQAIEKKAALIIKEYEGHKESFGAPVVYVKNARLVLAKLCSSFYNEVPSKLLAVTGTNGKSSTVNFVSQILYALKIPSANIGTLGVNISSKEKFSLETKVPSLTTFDQISIHKILNEIAKKDINCAAIEATSHGLSQYRLHGLKFDCVAITNITQDHLDYHKTMGNYASAKMILFSDLAKPNATAILNRKSAYYDQICEICERKKLNLIVYHSECEGNSTCEHKEISSRNVKLNSKGAVFDLNIFGETFENTTFNLQGLFQIENLMCAIGMILGAYKNINISDIVKTIPLIKQVPARLELIAEHKNSSIFVDFCHTPAAMQEVLLELRRIIRSQAIKGKLIIIFGCGGERDQGKRAQMGYIASKYADKVIVTDDNPRREDPKIIREEILKGVEIFNKNLQNGCEVSIRETDVIEICDRKQAILITVAQLNEGDIMLIAGRGHEMFQLIGEEKVPFNDKDVALEALF